MHELHDSVEGEGNTLEPQDTLVNNERASKPIDLESHNVINGMCTVNKAMLGLSWITMGLTVYIVPWTRPWPQGRHVALV